MTKNDKEAKSQEQRCAGAVFLSILLHVIFILFFSQFQKDPPLQEERVMTVRLVQEVVASASSPKERKENGKIQKTAPVMKKKSDTVKQDTSKNREKKVPVYPKKTSTQKEKREIERPNFLEKELIEKESQLVKKEDVEKQTVEEDIFSKWEEVQENEKRKLEEEFFANSKNRTEEDLQDFNFSDDLLTDEETKVGEHGKSSNLPDGSKNGKTGEKKQQEGIEWDAGGLRGLLISGPLDVPEEVKKAGLKFLIEINFTVDADGYIRNSQVIKSSGNSSWDEEIRRQFSRWMFEKSQEDELSSGKIRISVGY